MSTEQHKPVQQQQQQQQQQLVQQVTDEWEAAKNAKPDELDEQKQDGDPQQQ